MQSSLMFNGSELYDIVVGVVRVGLQGVRDFKNKVSPREREDGKTLLSSVDESRVRREILLHATMSHFTY